MSTPDSPGKAYTQVHDWLRQRNNFLIVTHQHPDGDAVGAVLGLAGCLRARNIACRGYFDQELPPQFMAFMPDDILFGEATAGSDDRVDLAGFDNLICLDCATPDRLALPNGLALAELPLEVCNIDHHFSNPGFGAVSLVDPAAAATSEILFKLFTAFDLPVTPEVATGLLIGITQDTGCFRFHNTSAAALGAAARLIAAGGDYHRVTRELYFNTPIHIMRLQASIILEKIRFAFDDRLAYFFVTDELLAEYGATREEVDDLIEVARTIAGVEVVCRLLRHGPDVRFSLRSQNPARPVLEMAGQLGGGGHRLAAGATLANTTLAEAEAKLLELAGKLFDD